ncbi:P-loop containing nucleoside triphosphate hydrolase protein [Mycena vulgaris]|nr:P-loop containing nucleoside triphosphate hydrolase protein [Mycena vulgaris]
MVVEEKENEPRPNIWTVLSSRENLPRNFPQSPSSPFISPARARALVFFSSLRCWLGEDIGPGLLGRVNAPGDPIDGKGPIEAAEHRRASLKATSILPRCSVNQPMMTHLKPIDAMVISHGQHELIIGDRQTGKIAVTVDTILDQKRWNAGQAETNILYCVYVAIGQKHSTVAQLVKTLKENDQSRGYEVCSIPAHFSSCSPLPCTHQHTQCPRVRGMLLYNSGDADTLFTASDASQMGARHLIAFPRVPEHPDASKPRRQFRLDFSRSRERAGASELPPYRCTPTIETQGGDVSAYIPTNVISITDGQTFLEAELFFRGVHPAINVGLSVSCVGSAAQTYVDTPKRVWIRNDILNSAVLARAGTGGEDQT